jgi:acyl-coenzyme A synthetase/AMP-(fatty) acid ligase/thioesterase domain-containing protein
MPAWLDDDRRPLDWNGPVDRPFTRFPDSALDRPIIDHLEHAVRLHRNRIAIGNTETALTFGQLWDGLNGLAETLATDGEPGDTVGILLPTGPMFALAMFACLAAGRPFVALDADHPQDWLDHALEDAQPAAIITAEDGFAAVDMRLPPLRVIRLTAVPKPAQACWRPARLGLDEPACVLFTSGSSGRPKGIVNSQRNILQRVIQSINAAHINEEDRFLTLAPPCSIVGVRDVMTAVLAGASIHLVNPRVGVREISSLIHAEAITLLFAFPALLRSVVAASPKPAAATLRLVRVGGDTTLWSDIDMLRSWLTPRADIQLIYAATEAPMLQWFVDDSCRGEDARTPVGYPLRGNRLAIVDEEGGATRPGEVGELIVASRYVSLGCRADGRWVCDGVETRDLRTCRTFRTGDLVRQRPDGLLERLGRKDRQVKIRGVRVHLEGVEALLRRHPFVRDVAALARTSSVDIATTLVAYVSPHEEAPAELVAELRTLMRSAPAPMRPARFYLVDEIPRLPSSKLDVRALIDLDTVNARRERAQSANDAELAWSLDDRIAQNVARVWQDILLVPVGGPDDDFFEAGGDSLNAITFAMELERVLGMDLSPTLIYEAPRFSEFCKVLRECRTSGYGPLVPLKAGVGSPLFFIHGVGGNVVEILPTARRVAYPGSVIGIRARGLARGEMPHSSVEAMATDYLTQIRAHQPDGPYFLCGYSLGGLVAFEIARQLAESGDEVRFVGLFDTLMSPLRWPLRAWLSIIGRRLARLPSDLRAAALGAGAAEPPKPAGPLHPRLAAAPASIQRNGASLHGLPKSLPLRVLRVAASALIASARFRPGFYCGELTLFTPANRVPGLPSLEAIWRKHARTLSVVETGGAHSTMLSAPHADAMAASLTRCLWGPARD